MPRPQTPRSAKPTEDILAFRQFLSRGKPGPHAYAALVGLRTFDTTELLKEVERGLPFRAFDRFRRNIGLPTTVLADLVHIGSRTLTRRREQGRLQPDESDRLLRASRTFGKALELFEGDDEAARRWLSSPQLALGGAVPLDLAHTEMGAREVEDLIGRLEHGVFS
jgi:putative toxin-antitoxin system antitoxin component (TIGR02293 family)